LSIRFSWCETGGEYNKYNNDLERIIFCLMNSNSNKKVGATVKGKPRNKIHVTFIGEEILLNLCKKNPDECKETF
jgi:hypothetical protein